MVITLCLQETTGAFYLTQQMGIQASCVATPSLSRLGVGSENLYFLTTCCWWCGDHTLTTTGLNNESF